MKEKNPQEKNAAERQVSLITDALSKAPLKVRGFKLSEAEGLRPFRTPRSRIAGI